MILAIRTDQPEAEVCIVKDEDVKSCQKWEAHRTLSDTLLKRIQDGLDEAKASFNDLTGVVVFKGPGSFTGLRIGITVANTIAYSQSIPVVSTEGDNWLQDGINRLNNSEDEQVALPEYGRDAHITKPKK